MIEEASRDGRGTDLERFQRDFGEIRGAPKCSVYRQGRCAEHFQQNSTFSLRRPLWDRFCPSRGLSGELFGASWSSLGCLGRSWGGPGRVHGRSRGFFGRLLERSWALWKALRDAKGSQGAPATDFGVILGRFSNDFEWISLPQFAHELDFGQGDTALSMWQNKPNFLQRHPCCVAA